MGAKTTVDASVIKTMGTKLEIMDSDLNAALEMLRKDHMCCRGHDISTKEDKKAYDELKDKLLGHNVTWGGTEDDQGASGSLGTPGGSTRESPYVKYQEAARLDLPSLRAEHTEQTAYEAPDLVGTDTEPSRAQSISPEVVPGTPQPLRLVRGTPKIMVEGTPQLSRPSPKLPQVKVQDTTQFDTPSPQSISNKEQEPDTTSPTFTMSTAELSPTLKSIPKPLTSPSSASPALPSAGTSSAGAPSPSVHSSSPKASLAASLSSPRCKGPTIRQATPKRVSSPLSPSLESATKRRRTWRQEEENDSDSEGTVGTLDSTYECISSIPPWKPMPEPVKEGMNDTMVLVEKLDNAGLDSPLPAKISSSPTASRLPLIPTTPSSPSLRPAGANSTFAVSEEQEMEVEDQHLAVDRDHLLPHAASPDSAGLNDVSYIGPPKGPTRSIRSSSASPIKAGMGMRSPLFHRSPSPLRQSTMLDLQPRERVTSEGGAGAAGRSRTTTGGKKNSPSAIPRRSPRNEFAAPTPRMPGSSQKPRAGVTPSLSRGVRPSATTPQPQRKVVAKKTLKHSVSA